MAFRDDDALEATLAALEQLREADAILSSLCTPGGSVAAFPRGWAGLLFGMDFTRARQEVARADGHLRRAIVLADGSCWLGGADDDGSLLQLDTTIGLRRAVRQYFARLLAADPRLLARVAPLG